MAEIHSLTTDSISDDALMQRLFELACSGRDDRGELARIDALVYSRLARAYSAAEPPRLAGSGSIAA